MKAGIVYDRFVMRSLLPLYASLLFGVLVSLGVVALRNSGSMEILELETYDWLLRLRPEMPAKESLIILIVATEADIQKRGWPLNDRQLAQVLTTLKSFGPRVIGVDIYRDLPLPPGTQQLERILGENPDIIMTKKLAEGSSPGIPAPAVLRETPQVGFNDVLVDRDGIVRRGLLFAEDSKGTAYSFALRVALLYLAKEHMMPAPDPDYPERLRLGPTTIRPLESNDGGYVGADARGYQFLIDYRELRGGFPAFDLASLLAGRIKPAAINDKIVLVGVKAESVPDIFHTPLSSESITGGRIPGVELHASIVRQLLRFALDRAAPIKTLSDREENAWIFLWGIFGSTFGLWAISPWRFSLLVGIGLLLIGLFSYGALVVAWWIPLVPPAVAWFTSSAVVTAYRSYQERKQRGVLMQLFARHVSAAVADIIWQQRDEFLDGRRPRPQQLMATVMFTDLVDFTSISEKLDPAALIVWLNEYMEEMGQQVVEHRGVLSKYIGDSIMAIFGVPVPRKTDVEFTQDAINAMNCALDMGEKLLELNHRWQRQGRPTTAMRIGLFTGPMVVGSLGSSERLEYTVIGDSVNTASRLEGFDKDGFKPDVLKNPCRVLIGASTYRYVKDYCDAEKLGEVSLKGKDESVTVYRLIGRS